MELSFWPMWGGNLQTDLCVLQEGPALCFPGLQSFSCLPRLRTHD